MPRARKEKVDLKALSDKELLGLLSDVKDELNSRSGDILIGYLKDYQEKNVNQFDQVDLTKLEKDVKADLGIDAEKFHELIKSLTREKKMYCSIVPGRELRRIKFFFQC